MPAPSVSRHESLITYTNDDGTVTQGPWLNVDVADGATLTNTTAPTAIASLTVEANSLYDGAVIEFRGIVEVPSTNATDTLALTVYFGGTTLTTALAASTAHDVDDNDVWVCEGRITVRDADASGTHVAHIKAYDTPVQSGTATNAVLGEYVVETTSVDFTQDLLLEIGAAWSVANAGNQCNTLIWEARVL